MTTEKTLHLRVTETLRTLDNSSSSAPFARGDLEGVLKAVEGWTGLMEPGDLLKLKSILQKYTPSASTNQLGVTRQADAGREAGARVASNLSHIADVQGRYRDFWDKKNAELNASICR